MVFPGTYSSGCARCKKRKIKCDERRPGCRRCELYCAACPGYNQPLAIRTYTRPGRSLIRNVSHGTPTKSRHTNPGQANALGEAWRHPRLIGPNIIHPPLSSFEDEAVSYFMQEHCISPGPGMIRGHLDFLPEMYQSLQKDSCLRPATLAASYTSLSRHYKSSTLYVVARNYYGAALRAVNRTLSNAPRTWNEELFLSLMFLGLVEDIDCNNPDQKMVHMLGIAKIYGIMGRRLLENIHNSSIDGWIFTEMQLSSLASSQDLDCLAIPEGDRGSNKNHPALKIATVVARIHQFFKLSKPLTDLKKKPLPPAEQERRLRSAIQQALAISSELPGFNDMTPHSWRPQQLTNENKLLAYTSTWTACVGSLYNATLIMFICRFLSCYQALLHLDQTSGTTLMETTEVQTAIKSMSLMERQLKNLIQIFCSSVPYILGEVDASGTLVAVPQRKAVTMHNLIWPLAIVVACPWSNKKQVDDCQGRLDWIRDRYGIKLASFAPALAEEMFN